MKKIRGQGSTEYLVILGAVLLVSLVIVSLLGSFPSSSSSTKEQQSKSYWAGTTPFAISTVKISNSTFTFTVSNKLTERVYLTAIEIQDGAGNNRTIMTPNRVFNAGEEITLTQLSAANITNSSLNPCFSTGVSKTGSAYEFKVVAFTYTQSSISGIRQQGSQPLIGRCSADLSVGDRYQGGKVFYILQPTDTGYVPGEQHGLIATLGDNGTASWGCYETLVPGADGTTIGTGHQNTHDIIAAGCTGVTQLCHGTTTPLSINGYSDWYIPSKDELNKLYLTKTVIGGFSLPYDYYWTSSQVSDTDPWKQYFLEGSQNHYYNYNWAYVRCVRSF